MAVPSSQGPLPWARSTPTEEETRRLAHRSNRHYEPSHRVEIDDRTHIRDNRKDNELQPSRSPVENRPRSRSNALEGRLSSRFDSRPQENRSTLPAPPASLPPRPRDTFHEEPRRANDDNRGESRQHRDSDNRTPVHWDRSPEPRDEFLSVPGRTNADHGRHFEPRLPPSTPTEPEPRRESKPVRIRRPARSPAAVDTQVPTTLEPQGNGNPPDRGIDSYDDKSGRNVKRGGSLLDRLTLDSPSPGPTVSSPSLRERVDVPMKRGNEDLSDLAAVPMAGGSFDVDGETGGKGGRGKRRNGKSRRGRKGIAP